jgi:diguanylate cyclase (GGDEF)-like protein
LGAALLPTILLISFCHLSLARDSSQVLVVALVIVGTARFPFPPGWIMAIQLAALIGWAFVSFAALPSALSWSLIGALAVVALLSSPYVQPRLSKLAGGNFGSRAMQYDGEPDGLGEVTTLAGALADCAADHFPNDKLTRLPGRNAFLSKLRNAVDQARGSSQTSYVAVMVLDLDGFKSINDSLSYEVGDQVLANAASRLRRCLRRRSDDFPARLGADEFAVLLQRLQKPDDVLPIAKRIQAVLGQAFQIGEQQARIGASIGVAIGEAGGGRAEDLLSNADTAMHHVKASRKGTIEIFTPQMHSEVMRTCRLRSDLWKALERNELLLHYQPLISLRRGHIAGAEALLRWRHPEGEIIPPLQFIPIAEETGLIEPIGEWVLETACSQNAAWQKAGLPPVPVAVNLSVHQLRQPNFCRMVSRVLEDTGLGADYLELELTETMLMDNLEMALAVIEQLTAMGVKISIDDFGTGYSSLGYLKRLPCDKLKIDRSFVADLTHDAKSAAIVGGLINLAHNLDLQVTAEGVEFEEQMSFLRAAGCDQMQGHLVSRPIEPRPFAELLGSEFNLYPAPALVSRDNRW